MKRLQPAFQISLICLLITLFSGCAKLTHTPTQISAADYLQLAQRAQGAQKTSYQLKAINAYLLANQATAAERLANSLASQPLSIDQKSTLALQKIQIALMQNRTAWALGALKSIDPKILLTNSLLKQYYSLYASAYLQKGDPIDSVNMRTRLNTYLDNKAAIKQNLWKIWQTLQTVSLTDLQADAAQTPDTTLQGWLNLAALTKSWESQPTQLIAKLKDWQSAYPNHPANLLLPAQIRENGPTIQPKQIALLVPLSGKYAHYGQAIRNGFFTAFYEHKKQFNSASTIRVYDTANNNIATIYQTAVNQGANMVVGPLQKENIQTLIKDRLISTTTLSLNTASDTNNETQDHLFTFGLSPIDEAEQTAQKAFGAQHQHIIIIAKNDGWSKSLVSAFSKQWQQLGGTITDTQWFNGQSDLSADIRNVLHIQQAYHNKKTLSRILNERIRYIPRRRKDFDSIFIVSPPQYAKQIIPLLRFYFAQDIPVFATSQIYNNSASSTYNRDLDGTFFCDAPWIINTKTLQPAQLENMRQLIQSIWPRQSQKYARFFALGVDAFDLTFKLNKMLMLPELSTLGATGTLSLTPSHHIYRQLPWALIKDGKPQPNNA